MAEDVTPSDTATPEDLPDTAGVPEETLEALWRQALRNREHDLYVAAWTVFMENMSVEVADKRLAEQKEVVIPFLLEIIDDTYLFEKEAPGDGQAPLNAVRLLGEWQVRDALPKLLSILEVTASYNPIYRPLIQSIGKMGPDVLDDVLTWVEEQPDLRSEAADIFVATKTTDPRAFDAVASWLEPEEYDLNHIGQVLIDLDAGRAVDMLRQFSQDKNFSKEDRSTLRDLLKRARQVVKQEQKATSSN
ncbi:MAG: hypothetical protein GYB66_08730 [Chloroflexi bacterium]|nr:hypothetical protein [Chloroflexota bacterium]